MTTVADPGEALSAVLQRMTEDHWEALEYVERYGLEPASEAVGDLEEWGLVYREHTAEMLTTDLGDEVLESLQ